MKETLNKKLLALISLGSIGACLTTGINFLYLFGAITDRSLSYNMAINGISLFGLSMFLITVGTAFGWFDKKEAKA